MLEHSLLRHSLPATLALSEVKRGVVAMPGALPRIVRTVGKPRALEIVLTGRTSRRRRGARGNW